MSRLMEKAVQFSACIVSRFLIQNDFSYIVLEDILLLFPDAKLNVC